MGFLAPLYALGALAIAAPILFHLIRRQPRGQSEFSSLMFLQQSPPRLTRRSRLDNIFLLLLRGLAICLIALAFARPFLRSIEVADARVMAREILVLVDTSGSMRRTDVWASAIQTAEKYVAGLGKEDRVGLATFDTELKVVIPLPSKEEAEQQTPAAQQAAVRSELGKLQPTYRGTKLAEQLMAAVELLQLRSADDKSSEAPAIHEIVLISDLHQASDVEALQGFDWPENVRLDVKRVVSQQEGNAHASVMQPSPEAEAAGKDSRSSSNLKGGEMSMGMEGGGPALQSNATTRTNASVESSTNQVRIRVENTQNAKATSISLRWLDLPDGNLAPTSLQVPAGQVRVVSMTYPDASANRIELIGDATNFDNIVYVPRTAPRRERLGFVGAKREKSEDDLYFFLSQVPLSTLVREVAVVRLSDAELEKAALDESLAGIVLEWPIATPMVDKVLDFAKTGRPVVVVMSRPIGEAVQAEAEANVARLLASSDPIKINEAATKDFALLTDIDFRHPLFQPLADAKYNDFGKVRFWAHRSLELPTDQSVRPADTGDRTTTGANQLDQQPWQVLARFDDKSPALIHRRIGRGDLWLLTAGWQSTGSQLALSSKFVPLVFGMLDPEGRSMEVDAIFEVGEPIPVTAGAVTSLTRVDGTPARSIDQIQGKMSIEEPGLYYLTEDGKRRQIAVTLPESESQLDPLDVDRFAQYGVITGKSDSASERLAAARLSQATELEGKQKLWRWILVGVIGLLVIETLVAGRISAQ